MATILEETPDYIRVQAPDGRPMTVPRATAERLNIASAALPPPVDSDLAGAPGASAMPPAEQAPVAPVQPPQPAQGQASMSGAPWALGGEAPAISLPTPVAKEQQLPAAVAAEPAIAQPDAPPVERLPQFRSAEEAADFFATRGFDRMQAATLAEADVAAREAAEAARKQEEAAADLARMQEQRAAEMARESERRQQLDTQVNAAVEAFANAKIDQGKWWANRSTGQKVLGGIAIALGALGGAMSGRGTNDALTMIMGAIDQDIKIQMADIDKMGQTVQMRSGQYDRFLRQMGDSQAAYNATMAGYLTRVEKQIEAIKERSKSEQVRIQADKLIAGIDMQRAEYLNKAGEAAYQRDFSERKFSEDKRQARAQEGLGRQRLKQDAYQFERQMSMKEIELGMQAEKMRAEGQHKEAEKLEKEQAKIREQGVYDDTGQIYENKDGKPWLLGNAERATKIRESLTAVEESVKLVDELVRLREEHGWSSDFVRSKEFQKMKSNWASLQLAEKDRAGLGVLSESDLELVNNVFGGAKDPTEIRDPLDGLLQYRKNAIQGTRVKMRRNGYTGEPVDFTKAFSASKGGDLNEGMSLNARIKKQLLARDVAERSSAIAQYGSAIVNGRLTPEQARQFASVATELALDPTVPEKDRKTFRATAKWARSVTGMDPVSFEPKKPEVDLESITSKRESMRR